MIVSLLQMAPNAKRTTGQARMLPTVAPLVPNNANQSQLRPPVNVDEVSDLSDGEDLTNSKKKTNYCG